MLMMMMMMDRDKKCARIKCENDAQSLAPVIRPSDAVRPKDVPTAAFALSVHLHDEDDNSLVPRVEYSSTRTTVRIVRGRLGVARSGPIAAFSRFPER